MEKWALLSVFEKKGIVEFAQRLVAMNWKILASGGTAKALRKEGILVKDVADLVGGGAILGHRVVTLSREVHAGLLADLNDPAQVEEMKNLGIPIIDLLVCDFYPLKDAIDKPDATIDTVVEATDIGGPCMVRSAAKGFRIVVCRSEDREAILRELEERGDVSTKTRQKMRACAEDEVAKYVLQSAIFHRAGQSGKRTNEQCNNFIRRFPDGLLCCIKDAPNYQPVECNFADSQERCPNFKPEEWSLPTSIELG
jgi:phosphoribosylaminoimidazolecarboxamide formyltransferase / IMP cyclohydrolase